MSTNWLFAVVVGFVFSVASWEGACAGGIQPLRQPSYDEIAGVLQHMRNTLYDPYSVRDAKISTVAQITTIIGVKVGPFVCVRMRAKNAYGAYIGALTWRFMLKDTFVVGVSADRNASDACGPLSYRPFTEWYKMVSQLR